jgi:hypothetical protein
VVYTIQKQKTLLLTLATALQILSLHVARLPNVRPNNSKQAPKNISWPGKICDHEQLILSKKGRKEDNKEVLKHTAQQLDVIYSIGWHFLPSADTR